MCICWFALWDVCVKEQFSFAKNLRSLEAKHYKCGCKITFDLILFQSSPAKLV